MVKRKLVEKLGVLWAILVLCISPCFGSVRFDATYDVDGDLDVGRTSRGYLYGNGVNVANGRLYVPGVYGDVNGGYAFYGYASGYLDLTEGVSWGQNTIVAIFNLTTSPYPYGIVLSTGAGYNTDSRDGIILRAHLPEGPGPSLELYNDDSGPVLTARVASPSGELATGEDYFVAASWRDNGGTISMRIYVRRVSDLVGTSASYTTTEQTDPGGPDGFVRDVGEAGGPAYAQRLHIGRGATSIDKRIDGNVDRVVISDNFTDTESDFGALFANITAQTPFSNILSLEAGYKVDEDLDIGEPSNGTLLGHANVANGMLNVNVPGDGNSGASYGDTTSYLDITEGSTWGENTIVAVLEANEVADVNLMNVFLNSAGPYNSDNRDGIRFYANYPAGGFGPALTLCDDGEPAGDPVTALVHAANKMEADTLYFVAASWKDTLAGRISMHLYMREFEDSSGSSTVYVSSEPNDPGGPSGFVRPDAYDQKLSFGRDLSGDKHSLFGSIDMVRCYKRFFNFQSSFDILFEAARSHCGDTGTVMAADINKDCYVDFKDLAEFAKEWLICTAPYNDECITLDN